MTFELIFFVSAILLGLVWYWRESKQNKLYRFVNKIFNSKELQMKATDKKGFIYQQSFLLRLVYITVLFLLVFVVFQFIVPVQLNMVSVFASMITGTLLGTYLAIFIFKSSEVIEEQTESLEEFVQDTIEKGKDFVEDLTEGESDAVIENKEIKKIDTPKEKSARERLKDKGYL